MPRSVSILGLNFFFDYDLASLPLVTFELNANDSISSSALYAGSFISVAFSRAGNSYSGSMNRYKKVSHKWQTPTGRVLRLIASFFSEKSPKSMLLFALLLD